MKKLADLLKLLDSESIQDIDSWNDDLHEILKEIIRNSDSLEESVLGFFATSFIENEVLNGGFAQAFMNLGLNSEWFEFAINGYEFFKKNEAAKILREARTLASMHKAEFAKIANEKSKDQAMQIAIKFFKLDYFHSLDKKANKEMILSNDERVLLVKKYRKDFYELV